MNNTIHIAAAVGVAMLLTSASGCTQNGQVKSLSNRQSDPNVPRLIFKSVRGLKPPMRVYDVEFEIRNPRDQPTWVVMPINGEEHLPVDRRFVSEDEDGLAFRNRLMSSRDNEKYSTYENGCIAAKSHVLACFGSSFLALKLEPNEKFHLDDCVIGARGPIHEYDVWVVSEILVNDSVPLDKWISARMTSQNGVYGTLTDRNRDPDAPNEIKFEAKREPVDFISSVSMSGIRRWRIPLEGAEKASNHPWGRGSR